MAAINHPYYGPHMTRTSRGNVAACCTKPESEHPTWVNGTPVRIVLKHDVRSGSHLLPKGTVVNATRAYEDHGMVEIRPSRWGINVLGQFAEIDKGEFGRVNVPSYTVALEERYGVGIPVKWAKEV